MKNEEAYVGGEATHNDILRTVRFTSSTTTAMQSDGGMNGETKWGERQE